MTSQERFTTIDSNGGAAVPGYTGGGVNLGRVTNLGIGNVGAINTNTPIAGNPGQRLLVDRLKFTYEGPQISAQLGVGWIPRSSIFTIIQFDDGRNLVKSPLTGWGHTPPFIIPNTPTKLNYDMPLTSLAFQLSLTIPDPGGNHLRVNGQGAILEGDLDVWFWLYDIAVLGSWKTGPETSFLAKGWDNAIVNNSSGGVSSTDLSNLQVGYSIA